jgi:alkylation response protein AidB-like acyl-CoA dehydrogenase
MQFLRRERDVLNALLPGLDEALAAVPLEELERCGGPGIAAFRAAGGPALLVPAEHAGIGADPVQAVRVQRAIGARAPSLAVASTMHHISVASLVEASAYSAGFEWMLLEGIATGRLLVASGFAEGRPGQAILQPTMRAELRGDVVVVSGSKKPCSLAQSMDLLTASVAVPSGQGGRSELAVALIPANSPGLERRPFWNSFVLAGTESDEVVLRDVEVEPDLLVRTEARPDNQLDRLQTTGFLWFELLMSASYLGIASSLAERVLTSTKVPASDRSEIGVELEAAMTCLEGVARGMLLGNVGDEAFAEALICRYAVQDAITRASRRCVESLGGMAYIGSSDVAYLAADGSSLTFNSSYRS